MKHPNFFQRFASTAIDAVYFLAFSALLLIAAESSSGRLFPRMVFLNESSVARTLGYLLTCLLISSFACYLAVAFSGGSTLGKIACNYKLIDSKGNQPKKSRLFIREVICKWFIFIAVPSLLFIFGSVKPALILVGIYIFIALVFRIIKRKTVADMLSGIQGYSVDGKWKAGKHLLSVSATVIDFSIVLGITLLLNFAVKKCIYIDFFNLMFLVILAYAVIAGLLRGQTAGKYFCGIELGNGSGEKIQIIKSLKSELLKFGLLIALPYTILYIAGITDPYAIFLDIALIAGVTAVFPYMFYKKTLWRKWSEVSKRVAVCSIRRTGVAAICLIAFWGACFALIKYQNNRQQPADTLLWGFHFPHKFSEYPDLQRVQRYAEFMHAQNVSPVKYLLNLFEQYDIVVLQETAHGESTQWEMISSLVSDSTFIHNVGHVFTEYGSAFHQDKIDAYLNTVFPNDTVLEQETAMLMYYMSGGFYYFIKKLNLQNAMLPDSLKVREHYTDVIDWDYFPEPSKSRRNAEGNRDSQMAQVVIDWYNQQILAGKRHKCLVVTNTRHAFGYAGGVDKVKNSPYFLHLTQGNQGQYITEAFPDKTANVAQNRNMSSRSFYYMQIYSPIHHGIWDKAHALNGNRPVGFSLKDTPFGEDLFEYRQRGAKCKLKYSDIFTGIIFNKPYMEQREVYHPYHKYAIEQEALRKGITDVNIIRSKVNYHDDNSYCEDNMRWANSISMGNFAGIFCFIILMGIAALLVIYHLLYRIFIYRKLIFEKKGSND